MYLHNYFKQITTSYLVVISRDKSQCTQLYGFKYSYIILNFGGARGVMVIIVGNGHGDTSSNPGQD